MEIKNMTAEQALERRASILEEMEVDGADLEALKTEAEEIRSRIEELEKEAEAERAEIRKLAESSKEIQKVVEVKEMEERTFGIETMEYRNAWLKTMMGKDLTVEERDALDSTNASAGYTIPTITANKIIENMVQIAPLLGEIDLMHIPSNVTLAVEGTVNDATVHSENASVTPASDTITRVTLGGYELMKLISISAKLEAMAIDAFETWIVSNLSRKLAELMENYIVNGTGSSQPKGIDYAETWADTTNAVDWASTSPTAAEIIEQISYLNGAYVANAKFLMNFKTFMNRVFSLRDDKKPAVLNDGSGITGWKLFGFPVVFSSKVADDDIFLGDFREGVKANLSAPVRIEADRSSGFRSNSIDYRGTCLFDCTTVSGRIIKSAPTL